MHELYELKEKLMKELAEYSENGKFSKEDAEAIKYISSSIDHICNIVERMEDEGEGYSERGGSYRGGSYGGSYARGGGGRQGGGSNRGGSNRGGSYEGGGMGGQGGSYEGSYARGGRGRNARRDSMGRYSSEQGYSREAEEMADQLRELMEQAPDETIRRDIERLLRKVEQM